jgi:mono/diheme cytochrome c family protein
LSTRYLFAFFLLIAFLIAGCTMAPGIQEPAATAQPAGGMGMMQMGGGGGMMARHHATVPAEYAGLTNPVPADEESLARGAGIYELHCTTCHGEGGMGDGPAGQQLDPPPAAVAHTSRMLGDDYLFWRVSEGGAHEPFRSAMPSWQDVLDDTDRWDVINYVRALGSGQAVPGRGPGGGAAFDPAVEAQRHADMAAAGVAQGVISQEEADTFLSVHAELDALMGGEMAGMSGGMTMMQEQMLAQLVEQGTITLDQAATFGEAHEKLLAAGLME